SSQSTLPSFRAMKPSRLATMWIVTRESALAIGCLQGRQRGPRRQSIARLQRSTAGRATLLVGLQAGMRLRLLRPLLPPLLVLRLHLFALVREALADLVHLGLLLVVELLELRRLLIVERTHFRGLRGLDQVPALVLERGDLWIELVPQCLHLRLQ